MPQVKELLIFVFVQMKDISYTKTEAFFSTKYIFCAATLGLTKDGRYVGALS